ncbi:MAG: YmdB family metallophosphoesterase [Selenomonadaceae bacterium]|nr:YmdB family metallophosphoesterase [Selenomonadaceae bacterium]
MGPVINRFVTGRPGKFEVAKGAAIYCAVLIDIDDETNKAVKIERVQIRE